MSAEPVTLTLELDSLEADIESLESVERALLDTMLMMPSTRDELGDALMNVHSVAYSLRLHLEQEAKS
jgi:hypothetical protein